MNQAPNSLNCALVVRTMGAGVQIKKKWRSWA
jgi:hypothetical protein